MRNRSILLLCLLLIQQLSFAAIRVPFRYRSGLIVADFNFNGKVKAPFIFDTGAATTAIDSMAAQALQLKAEGRQTGTGAGGSALLPVVYNQEIHLSKDEIVNLTQCFIVNLQTLRERNGEDFIGIIGYDLLKNYTTTIDFDRKELIFDTKAPGVLNGYTKIHFNFANSITIPQLKIAMTLLNGTTLDGTVFFDSGAALTMLINSPFKTANFKPEVIGKTITSKTHDLTQMNMVQETAIASIQIGEHKFSDLPISLSSDKSGVSSFPGYMGILGSRIISRFNVVLDYKEKALYLKPNQSYSSPFDFPMSGLRFKKINGKVFISSIIEGSPAADAGLQEGQPVVSVDGYKGSDLDKIYKLLQQEGKTVTVAVSINGEVKNVPLKLKRLL